MQELIRVSDPFDNVVELFHGVRCESRPLVTPYAATFVTGDQRMGHLVLPVDDDVEALLADVLTVEDSRWVARESTAVSSWGHDLGGGR